MPPAGCKSRCAGVEAYRLIIVAESTVIIALVIQAICPLEPVSWQVGGETYCLGVIGNRPIDVAPMAKEIAPPAETDCVSGELTDDSVVILSLQVEFHRRPVAIGALIVGIGVLRIHADGVVEVCLGSLILALVNETPAAREVVFGRPWVDLLDQIADFRGRPILVAFRSIGRHPPFVRYCQLSIEPNGLVEGANRKVVILQNAQGLPPGERSLW